MSYTRKYFSGAAVANTISAPIGSSDVTIALSSALVGWPVNFPFMGVLDKGTSNEEKILISAGTTSLTVTRGQDGTTAVSHANGASLQHCLDSGTISNHETFEAGNGTVTPSTSAVGDAAVNGVSALPAAADHKHAREAFGSGQSSNSAVGDTAADGSATQVARADHKHGRESYATIAAGTASIAVTESNKRITKRVVVVGQSATPSINTDNTDVASITGLAQAVTSMTTNLSGTPVAGDTLIIEITDNGTARALAWGAKFEGSTVGLPNSTVASTLLTVGFRWNAANSAWHCVAVA